MSEEGDIHVVSDSEEEYIEEDEDSQNNVFDYPSGSEDESDDTLSIDDFKDDEEYEEEPEEDEQLLNDLLPYPWDGPEITWQSEECGVCKGSCVVSQVEGRKATLAQAAQIQRAISIGELRPNPRGTVMGIPQSCTQGHVVCRECVKKSWGFRTNWSPRLARCLYCGFGSSAEGMAHLGAWLLYDVRGWVQWTLSQ